MRCGIASPTLVMQKKNLGDTRLSRDAPTVEIQTQIRGWEADEAELPRCNPDAAVRSPPMASAARLKPRPHRRRIDRALQPGDNRVRPPNKTRSSPPSWSPPRHRHPTEKCNDVSLTAATGLFQNAAHLCTDRIARDAVDGSDFVHGLTRRQAARHTCFRRGEVEQRLYQLDGRSLQRSHWGHHQHPGAAHENVARGSANWDHMRNHRGSGVRVA